MKKTHMPRRYLLFFIGLLLNAFGVAFVTKGGLGTSPIASIPYSISLITNVTIGIWMALFNIVLIILQWIILRKEANKIELGLQVIIALTFGYFTTFAMDTLVLWNPEAYPMRLLSLVLGCIIIAFGAYLELVADVVMLPADAFVRAIAYKSKKEYGTVRIISDTSMALISAILCLVFLHQLVGVREGTIISAIITGNIVKFFKKTLVKLSEFLVR